MSSLQIGLAVAGGLVLAAVVAHSAWTSRKNAPRQAQPESVPSEGSPEPLAETERQDPGFDGPLDAHALARPREEARARRPD